MPSGGYRPGAGRPRKNIAGKKLEGRPSAGSATWPKPKAVEYGEVMDVYFSAALLECAEEVPPSDVLRTEIEAYISAMGCEGYVAPRRLPTMS